MDNPTTDPQGAVDVSASEGQSTQVETQPAQEAQETQETQETQPQEAHHPWEADERFKGKSPEEMYNLVKEADKYKGELGKKAKIADLLQKKYGVDPDTLERLITQQQQQQPQGQEADPTQMLQQQVMQTQQQIAMMKEEQALDNYLKDNPEMTQFKDKLMKLAFTAERDKSYEEIGQEYFGQAIKTGQQSAYKKIETKQQTQPTGVSNAEQQRPNLDELSSTELEKILPWAN